MTHASLGDPLPRAEVAPVELPGVAGLLTLAVCVVVVSALYFASDVLIPVTLAVLLSFLLAPLVSLLRRAHLHRIPAVGLAILVALGLILATGSLIGTQIADLAGGLPQYETAIRGKIDTLRQDTLGRLDTLAKQFGRRIEHTQTPPPPPVRGVRAPAAGSTANPMIVEVQEPSPTAFEIAQRILAPIVGPLGRLFLVLIVSVFILAQQEDLRDRLIRLFGSNDLHRTTLAMNDAARRLSKYFLTQLAINAGFGVVIGVGLFVIGVPSPVLWAILAALLRFVPYVGTPIAAAFPMLLAAAIDPGWGRVLSVFGLFALIEPILGQVVEPLLYGHSTGLSPVSVVISAIFWTWLWGPIGLILSTPLTLCLVVLGRHVKRLEFLDVLLGDRPPLTPVETLYQRMLAGDADSAATQATILLRDRSLSAYYDEVVLPGLRMAAHDLLRGVLAPERLAGVHAAVVALTEELEDHQDSDPPPGDADDGPVAPPRAERDLPHPPPPGGSAPPPGDLQGAWHTPTPVLCLAGRTALDEAACAMLAQLLGKHGLAARVLPAEAASRTRVADIDLHDTAMVVLSYFEATGSPSHLRFVLRRLRQSLPHAPIVVGLWPGDDPSPREEELRRIVGTDTVAVTLRHAVDLAVADARSAVKT